MKLTEAEWSVMEALWAGESFSLGELTRALYPEHGWSKNTVHTYLTRMEAKGLVAIGKDAVPHRYRAAVAREDWAAEARRGLLEQVYRGAAGKLVAAFLKDGGLTSQEREELRRLLDEMEV